MLSFFLCVLGHFTPWCVWEAGFSHGTDEFGPRWEQWEQTGEGVCKSVREETLTAGHLASNELPTSEGVQVREGKLLRI